MTYGDVVFLGVVCAIVAMLLSFGYFGCKLYLKDSPKKKDDK